MAADLGHIRSELTTYHGSVVDNYLDHFGLTALPHFEFANAAETEIVAFQPGATINSDGLVEYIYNERPVTARVSDLVVALQNKVLFSDPGADAKSDPPEPAESSAPSSRSTRRTRATRKKAAEAEESASASEESAEDATPNS